MTCKVIGFLKVIVILEEELFFFVGSEGQWAITKTKIHSSSWETFEQNNDMPELPVLEKKRKEIYCYVARLWVILGDPGT